MTKIVVVAMGEMGAAIAGRLVENGADVVTSLKGRSAASAERARAAGVRATDDPAELLTGAEAFLSIVPPARAREISDAFLPAIVAHAPSATYFDCNAIAPSTLLGAAKAYEEKGVTFADASIIGAPPRTGSTGTRLYVSGPTLAAGDTLKRFGLEVFPVSQRIGSASALKLAYSGVTKAYQALALGMIAGAAENDVLDAFWDEMHFSKPYLLEYFQREFPMMLPKAHRWAPEMDEIADFVSATPANGMPRSAAEVYRTVAAEPASEATNHIRGALDRFLARRAPST
jgi:3-hydroxyisobutyrate dehydrogenase-like beta-hydroxyacid dehydrogenase